MSSASVDGIRLKIVRSVPNSDDSHVAHFLNRGERPLPGVAAPAPHVGEQGSWGATRDGKIVVRHGGAWIILKLGR